MYISTKRILWNHDCHKKIAPLLPALYPLCIFKFRIKLTCENITYTLIFLGRIFHKEAKLHLQFTRWQEKVYLWASTFSWDFCRTLVKIFVLIMERDPLNAGSFDFLHNNIFIFRPVQLHACVCTLDAIRMVNQYNMSCKLYILSKNYITNSRTMYIA